jgi:protein-S-isoprenylcysteine O-methyltransferase Ste14
MAAIETVDPAPDGFAATRDSARGWHQIQIAVLGFVGLCGVLQHGRPGNPKWLQTLAALFIFSALVTALAAVFIVGRVAWPPAGATPRPARQLRTGILLTFVAVGLLALGTSSMWWPEGTESGGQVQVRASDGQTWCGRLIEAREGAVAVQTERGSVILALADVSGLSPVDACD